MSDDCKEDEAALPPVAGSASWTPVAGGRVRHVWVFVGATISSRQKTLCGIESPQGSVKLIPGRKCPKCIKMQNA